MTNTKPRLGVDIGRVIIGGTGSADTSFFSGDQARMLSTPAVPGAFEVLARLVPRFDQVWLVSKCGDRVRANTKKWLYNHDFAARTGIPQAHLRFCYQRPEKADHCAHLGITHFIDDKLDVHEALRGIVEHSYLFGPQRSRPPAWLRHTPTWPALEAAITTTLG